MAEKMATKKKKAVTKLVKLPPVYIKIVYDRSI